METKLVLKRSGAAAEETKLLSFTFVKDAYMPYTTLTASFAADSGDNYFQVREALLYVNGKNVHHGLVDSFEFTESFGKKTAVITSRGFTSLLCQNQIEPGLKTNLSLNSLMDDNYTLPHVTHESSSDTSGYIFVKNTSSMWDGIVNLTYKLNQTYPYIRGTNHVRITQAAQPSEFSYSDDELIESGFSHNYKRLVSHFNMADMSGEYGTYELEDEYAASKEIVRHKFFELDRQFLYDPLQALEYRRKFAERASYRRFCRYSGYNGEDLSDKVSFGIISGSRICGVKIIGNSSGVTTELSVYHDGFYSSVTD